MSSSSNPGLLRRHPLPALAVAATAAVTLGAMAVSLSHRFPFRVQLHLSHLALIVVAMTMVGLALYFRDWTKGVLARFFLAAERPTNLAVYRIVLFATIFFDLDHDANRKVVTFFANLPKGLQIPPPGLGPMLKVLPVNATLANLALTGITVFSFLALIGFRTRLSAALTVACQLYGLGIAQFYGQVNHYHHMIWFAAILAASRCGDALSVDAFLAARTRGARDGTIEPPAESRAYALPLRLVWITIGVLYFFPGFWKYWRTGMDWAFGTNFVHQMHLKWMQVEWTPQFRIDNYPLLYMPAAFLTLVWEIFFLPAMLFPRLRMTFAVVGACFHVSTRLILHISFWTLQSSYLSFFNWHSIFGKLGKRLFPAELVFLYDGNDPKVRARLAAWRTLDVLRRVTFLNVHDDAEVASAGRAPGGRLESVRAVACNAAVDGAAAWRALAKRIPLLWVAVPFVGDTKHGDAPVAPAATRAAWFPRGGLVGVWAVFFVLLLGNLTFGVMEQRTGFPFTCYPPFSRDPGPTASVIYIEPIAADGNVIRWDEKALKKRFGSARYVSLIKNLRSTKDPKKFHAFWEVVARENPQVKEAQTVRFWETTLRTDPRYWGDEERQRVSRELVYTYVDYASNGGDGRVPDGSPLRSEAVTSTEGLAESADPQE